MNFFRSVKTDKTGLYVAEKVIEFPLTMVGEKSQVKVKICNGSGNTKYSVSLNDKNYSSIGLDHLGKGSPEKAFILPLCPEMSVIRCMLNINITKCLAKLKLNPLYEHNRN